MILANVASANFVEKHEAAALYRVHEQPDSDRFANFKRFLAELGITADLPVEPTPLELKLLLERLGDRPDKELIETTLLRSLKQAVYQPDNQGHFGLALEAYAHFTSPIRRYPDLLLHRAIKAVLHKQGNAVTGPRAYTPEQMVPLGEQCSMTERRADDATREVSDWLKCEYMQDHIGDSFPGVVATVTNFGLFVRLVDLYIEGLVHVTSLPNDYYHFDTERQVLLGEHSKQSYRMGDLLEVKVLAVNLEARKIDLGVIGSPKHGEARKVSSRAVYPDERGSKSGDKPHKKGRAIADPTQRPGKTKAGRGGAKGGKAKAPAAKAGKAKAPRKRK